MFVKNILLKLTDSFDAANMRELAKTGFMSNRGRQIVASFLVRDMGQDWRQGAEHFETNLLDHDVTSNWGESHLIVHLILTHCYNNCLTSSLCYIRQLAVCSRCWCRSSRGPLLQPRQTSSLIRSRLQLH